MAIETFNERFLGNAKVPQSGSREGAGKQSPRGTATGMPSGVQKADGTAPLGSPVVTKQAAPRSAPSGGKKTPKGVDAFGGGSV